MFGGRGTRGLIVNIGINGITFLTQAREKKKRSMHIKRGEKGGGWDEGV
jgi:hypothetical protein